MQELLILKEPIGAITQPEDLFQKIKEINIDYTQENFIVFYLNTANQLIKSEVLFKGGLNSALVCFKTLFRHALLNNANSIIIAHNHPASNLNPSDDDIDIFNKLKSAGNMIQIKVLDSIIFDKKNYYAMKNNEGADKHE